MPIILTPWPYASNTPGQLRQYEFMPIILTPWPYASNTPGQLRQYEFMPIILTPWSYASNTPGQLRQYDELNKLVEFFQTEVSLEQLSNLNAIPPRKKGEQTQVDKWVENTRVSWQDTGNTAGSNSPAAQLETEEETPRSVKKRFNEHAKKTRVRLRLHIEPVLASRDTRSIYLTPYKT